MRQNDLLCAQSPVGAEPVNTVQIGGYARVLAGTSRLSRGVGLIRSLGMSFDAKCC